MTNGFDQLVNIVSGFHLNQQKALTPKKVFQFRKMVSPK